ncbi:MAG TPA: hypothetical protein VFW04_14630 [Gemmatimonadaceae bacterium]|nr:hypothetical protein [Gemmatimonadaceae bacterium]
MTRAALYLMLAATLANSPGTCEKSASSQSAAADPSAGGSGGDWTRLGAGACAKYFTPEVNAALLPGPGTPKTRNATSCTVEAADGSIQLSLSSDNIASFNAGVKFLPDTLALPGVGDRALQYTGGITAYKAPNRVCTFLLVANEGYFKQSGARLGQTLGAVCNKLFATNP